MVLEDSMDENMRLDIIDKLNYPKMVMVKNKVSKRFNDITNENNSVNDINETNNAIIQLNELLDFYNNGESNSSKILGSILNPIHYISCRKEDINVIINCIDTLYQFKGKKEIQGIAQNIDAVAHFIKNSDYTTKTCQVAIDFKDTESLEIIINSLTKASHYNLGEWEIKNKREDDPDFDEHAPDATKDLGVFDKYLNFIYKHKDHGNFPEIVNMLFIFDLNLRYDPRLRMSLFDKSINTDKFGMTFNLLDNIAKTKARRGTYRIISELNNHFYSDNYNFRVEILNQFIKYGDSVYQVYDCLKNLENHKNINSINGTLRGETFAYFYANFHGHIADPLKYSLTNKEINSLVQAHNVSIGVLGSDSYFGKEKFTELFFAAFDELISLYNTFSEQKDGINLWCEEVIKMSRKEHNELVKYFSLEAV